jgi:hypothetical protein
VQVVPLLVQLPLGQGRNFNGLVDLVNLTGLVWPRKEEQGSSGRAYRTIEQLEMRSSMAYAWEAACQVPTEIEHAQ